MSDLITPGGMKKQPKFEPKKPGREKPADVAIKQSMAVAGVNELGQPDLLIFGLGTDDMIYVWRPKERVWRER